MLAESTGKDGKGLIPVDREPLGPPEVYGNDRVFAYIRLESGADPAQDEAVDALAKAGHPVIRIALADIYNLGQEMFRWEIATAVAGSVIGINAFNQPDVEASKIATRKLTTEYEKTGSLPPESPILSEGGIASVHGRKECGGAGSRGRQRQNRGGLSASASESAEGGRLFRAAGLCRDERRARRRAAGDAHGGARQETRRHLSGIRPALLALHRPGLQGRAQQRRLPAGDLRR